MDRTYKRKKGLLHLMQRHKSGLCYLIRELMGWLILIQFDRSKEAQDNLFEVDYRFFLTVTSHHVTSNHETLDFGFP